jgi:hypothetical protein
MRTKFQWENPRRRENFGDLGVDGREGIKMDLKECGVTMWTGFIWLRIGTSGGLL